MRPAIKEYHYDWLLRQSYSLAGKLKKGFDKEYRTLLSYAPHYRAVIEEILYFDEVGTRAAKVVETYLDNIIRARDHGKKTAISTFCFSPAIFYAMDVVPITLELLTVMGTFLWKRGTAEYLDYCVEAGFTETSCSSQRGSLGAYLAGLGAQIDFVVIDSPGVCDTNANSFAFAAAYLDLPFFQLNMPSELLGERNRQYHREDYKALIKFLEAQTGKKLDVDKLREVLKEISKQDVLINDLEELQRTVPNPVPVSFNLLIYVARFLFAGRKEGTELLELLLNRAKQNHENGVSGLVSGREHIRALFCYIDHYATDMRLWKMLDDNGITHVGNILSRLWEANSPLPRAKGYEGESYTIDTASLDTMIDSIGQLNARMPMVKSIRGPYDAANMWLEDTLALAKMYQADMVVYNGTPGCRNTWGMVKLFAKDLEEQGYPTHVMYADAFDDRVESWAITKHRFEEFVRVRRIGQ